MLQPQSGFFRFMEFPPEIRTMVYACLFESDDQMRIITRKRVNQPRRPLPATKVVKRKGNRVTVEDTTRILPTGLHLLRTSKQILREAAPVLYGDNKFSFDDLADMKVFLDTIGSMRPYLRSLQVDHNGYWRSKARSTFALIKDATNLRSLTLYHADVCSTSASWYARYYTSPERLAGVMYYALSNLRKAHKATESNISILDIVKVNWSRCGKCEEVKPAFAPDDKCLTNNDGPFWGRNDSCKIKCKDAAEHCKKVEKQIRKAIAKMFNIDDEVAQPLELSREASQEL